MSISLYAKEQALLSLLAAKLSELNVSVIIGLVRGGTVPAVHLSHALGIPVKMVHVSLRDGKIAHLDEVRSVVESVNGIVAVVDDICDSGATLKLVYEAVSDASRLVSVVLYERATSEFKCDYVGEYVTTDQWIDFSWEVSHLKTQPSQT